MFETVAITAAISAFVFLPLGAIFGHSVAAHASAEARAIKAHVTEAVDDAKAQTKNILAGVAKKL